jgi:hypothetical protein
LVAENHANADANGLLASDALQFAVLQDAEQLGLRRLCRSPTSSRKIVPPSATRSAHAPQRRRAGERALLVTEQLASISSVGWPRS